MLGDKGDKGDKGEDGLDGKDGLNGEDAINCYDIAKTFGYQGNYGQWVKEIISGDLSVQYSVDISFDYKSFTYGWDNSEVELNSHTFLLDSRFTDEEVNTYDFIYNNINQALNDAHSGTEEIPMTIYIAPGVYWTHDPDSESTTDAYQISKECANMKWIGLTEDKRNVVIAFNYGHNVGYNNGNPTCFNIKGDNFGIENLTIGGYCNVDLVYNLNHTFDHVKRSTDVTQCQLGTYDGDKLYCNNVSFISRLNMMPFISSKRALYYNCHMESTDDSLNGSSKAVYLNCDFDFYASKPWGGSSGVTLLNCDFNICHINIGSNPVQYLAKGAGRFNVIDSRFHDDTYKQTYNIGWSDILSSTYRSYYSNVRYNGELIDFSNGGKDKDKGIDITGLEALKAYKIVDNKGKVTYNIYNLLRGNDEWDPLGQKEIVRRLNAVDIPTTLSVSSDKLDLETGKDGSNTATITYSITGPQSTNYKENSNVRYEVSDEDNQYVTLTKNSDGSATLVAQNESELAKDIIVNVIDDSGLCGAVQIHVRPSILDIDKATNVSIVQNSNGTASVSYTISNLGQREDNSRIKWYICTDSTGTNPILIQSGRGDEPLDTISLYEAYVGKYLKVTIETKHIRSNYGELVEYILDTPITSTGIEKLNDYDVDLKSFATTNANNKVDGYWQVNNVNYGVGNKNGFLNYEGLYFTGNKNTNFSYINYNTLGNNDKDMDILLKVAPGKTAGQGFGSNNNFLEVRIKYDVETGEGYALRIIRTSGDSTKVVLVKLSLVDNQIVASELATSENTSVYLTECTIHVWTSDNKIHANVTTSQAQPEAAKSKSYLHEVTLEADFINNNKSDFGLYYESSTGDNTTYISKLEVKWND